MAEPRRLTDLPADRLRLLMERLRRKDQAAAPGIERLARGGPLPLSFAQQRLWFLDRLEPGSPLYNMPAAVALRGRLDPAALAAALGEIARRHEALRATFREEGDEPVQAIAGPAPFPLPLIDLQDRPEEAARLRDEEARRPFDLGRGPLLRAALLRLGPEEHVLVVTMHHIVSDGWSAGVLIRELGALYAAAVMGVPSPLPELAIQYPDFAAWQRRHLSDERLADGLAWWRERLAGLPPALELPADHPRPARLGPRGGVHEFAIPEADLDRLARSRGATRFMALLAGFAALLGRYTGVDDLAVGTPVAGRDRSETEPLIGLFVNTLVLRMDLAGDPDAYTLLERAREATLAAFAHQEVPFDRLVEELAPGRDLSRPPLAQVMLVLQSAPSGPLELPGLAIRPVPAETGTAKLELTCAFTETEGGLAGRLEYSRDLFEPTTAGRMAGQLARLLAGAAAAPLLRLSELPLLSGAEREEILGWRRSPGSWAVISVEAGTAHGLFEEQARLRPEAVALVAGERSLSYGELARRSGALARALRRLGVGPEVRVGLSAERSLDLVVGILGILRAGGALVPLDPAHPAERLALLLADSGLSVVVAQEKTAAKLPAGGPPVVLLEGVEDGDWSGAGVPEQALAYVIYTSGSTGRPKGVGVSHANLVPMLCWSRGAFGLKPGTRVLQSLSYAFDFGLWEILTAVVSGAALHIPPAEETGDAAAFARRAAAEGIDVVHATPSFFRAVAETGARLGGLRVLHLGGEALSRTGVERLAAAVGAECTLYNGYGPTEVTVNSLLFEIGRPGSLRGGERTPVGSPSAESSVYVVDPAGGLVPVGVPGELWIGGPGVARGYLGRPELTAERFIPDAFGGETGGRLYRTGDLVRWLPDGTLEFLGRVDHQVKIRGFRIEPGEIEAALRQHPGVRAAAVVARGERLVACVVSEAGAAELRGFLRELLPAALIPAAFVHLAALPLTPTGKLDRRALPEPGLDLDGEWATPRTPAEELVAGIFAEVLDRDRVGPAADFFALGGHSLLATRVVSRVRAVLGVELPVRAVFEAPTVAALAVRIEACRSTAAAPEPLERASRREPLPLSFAQRRLWFLDRWEPGTPLYNIPAAVELRGRLDPAALAAALGEIVRRHEALRTTFREEGGEPAQVIAESAPFPLPLIDLQGRPEAAARLRDEEARRPFDLGRGPLLRATLLRLGPEEHELLVTMHHIVSDGWSTGVLVRELEALYEAAVRGASSPLPELAVQYADFATWQRRHLAGERLDAELAWWRQRLAGLPPALELPADHPRPGVPSGRGAVREFAVRGLDAAALGRLSRRHGATPFMTLLAVFAALLGRLTGAEDLAVGTPVAGRARLETEPLIGCFVNTLALRIDLTGAPDLPALLGRVRETTLAAYAHQEMPFERLVEELAPERDLSRSPLVQTMMGWEEAPAPEPRLPGLEARTVPVLTGTAKLDLSFVLHPADGGLAGALEYATDLFEPATAARLAGYYEALLLAAAASPGARLAEQPLLSPAERRQLVVEWNGAPDGPEPSAARLFAAQAARAPEAVALVLAGGTVTYGELDRETGLLARRLRALGVGPERTVGIHLPPSAATVAAVLAIWKAGGAWLALDPDYPTERLAFLLEDAGAAAVITTGELAGALPAGPARVLALDTGWEEEPGAAPAGDPPEIPESLAYVVYTSGSTGRPKGVGVDHRSLSRHLRNVAAVWELTAADRVLQLHSPSFDPWLEDVMAPLLAGAAVVVAGAGSWEPAGLLERAAALGVTVLNLPTVVWRQWGREAAAGAAPEHRVRLASAGGEPMPGAVARLWWASPLSRIRLLNSYGPTEAVVSMEFHEIGRAAAERAGASLEVGRPAAGRSAYVLDRGLSLLPAGVPGELCLGGPLLARGYLGRPEATAERFLPDPFAAERGDLPGARLYHTGDLARRRPDGVLEILGRADRQIKVRGFRVEPEEIEEALVRSPLVSRAVVLARPGPGGEVRLVAAVVPAPGAAPTADGLREHLGAALPAFMVPSAFVPLEDLPLTPNRAKVDRRAVERLVDAASPLRAAASRPPRTPVEELVAGVWSDLLGAPVGAEDDFFTLGGHSLLAVQLVSRLRDLLGVELAVRTVFERPTVAGLAEILEPRLRAALLMDAAGHAHEESPNG